MTITTFGTTRTGTPVQRLTLQHGRLRVSLLTWGAALHGVWLDGVDHNLTLSSDRLADYEDALPYHGTLIAPVINRLTNGSAPIGGQLHQFEPNQDGRHSLHSGATGSHRQVWDVIDHSPTSATLALVLADGTGGFPGDRRMTARYSLQNQALQLHITATTTQLTLMNAGNHSYWNLDGTPTWAGHRLRIAADRTLHTTSDLTPTGSIQRTADTPLDLREARQIAPGSPPLDTCFCLADQNRRLTECLWLTGQNGLKLTLATTAPALQVYDGRAAIRPGRVAYEGLAIEAQGWPDAPNHPHFPGIDLHPGQLWQQTTEWHFSPA